MMRILRLILVITLLLTGYSGAAQAFAGVHHCPKGMTMTGGKMMDCCKDKDGGMNKKCPCPACGNGMTSASAVLIGGAPLDFYPVGVPQDTLLVAALPYLVPLPEFRPPDFLA